jgi:ribosomal protein S18 acetylase RimI-like enzyme
MRFDIKVNQSLASDISTHLALCDAHFVPPLSSRVDVLEYAQKLASNAVRFEAWEGANLIGLLAAYCNDHVMRVAHITNISVVPMRVNNGVGTMLLQHGIAHIASLEMRSITLAVAQQNTNAIKMYAHHGFLSEATNTTAPSIISMRLILRK